MLQVIFGLNVVVAGAAALWVYREPAGLTGTQASAATYMVISFWLAIAIISLVALLQGVEKFVPVLYVQLLYKSLWVFLYAVPVYLGWSEGHVSTGVLCFFIAWMILVPAVLFWF